MRAAMNHPVQAPIYIRLGRGPEWLIDGSAEFEIGKAQMLRDGRNLTLVANGAMVVEAVLAADVLAEMGVAARVLNMHTVKPLDTGALLSAALDTPAMIVIEEHSVIGGLGAAVLEALAEVPHGPVRRIGIPDVFPPIGPTRALRDSLGLCADNIVAQALDLLGRG